MQLVSVHSLESWRARPKWAQTVFCLHHIKMKTNESEETTRKNCVSVNLLSRTRGQFCTRPLKQFLSLLLSTDLAVRSIKNNLLILLIINVSKANFKVTYEEPVGATYIESSASESARTTAALTPIGSLAVSENLPPTRCSSIIVYELSATKQRLGKHIFPWDRFLETYRWVINRHISKEILIVLFVFNTKY